MHMPFSRRSILQLVSGSTAAALLPSLTSAGASPEPSARWSRGNASTAIHVTGMIVLRDANAVPPVANLVELYTDEHTAIAWITPIGGETVRLVFREPNALAAIAVLTRGLTGQALGEAARMDAVCCSHCLGTGWFPLAGGVQVDCSSCDGLGFKDDPA